MRLAPALLSLFAAGCTVRDADWRAIATTDEDEPVPELERETSYYPGPERRRSRDRVGYRHADGSFEPHGVQTEWYPNGRRKSEESWRHGRKDGPWRRWDEDGNATVEEFWRDGHPAGTWRSWYPGGAARSEIPFDGPEPRTASWWHEGGGLSSCGPTVNGVREGVWTFWYPSGAVMKTGLYRRGRRQGPWTFWWEDGSLRLRGRYSDGARVGDWDRFDPGRAHLRPDGSVELSGSPSAPSAGPRASGAGHEESEPRSARASASPGRAGVTAP